MATKKKPAAKKKTAATTKKKADGLLERILADPADVESRAIFADRAMEAGDPRGTFIAHHSALAELDALDPRYTPLLASVERLQSVHGRTWIADYLARAEIDPSHHPRVGIDPLLNAVFENGFLRRIAMLAEHIEAEWPKLRAHEPIQGIELLVGEGMVDEHCHLASPKEFRVLKVSPESWFTSSSVARVLGWGMPHLRELDLSGCDLGITGARLLANLDTDLGVHFPDYVPPPPFARGQLKQLAVKNTGIGDAGALLLFAAKHLEDLEALDIAQCRIADGETLQALRALTSLKRLSLAGNNTLGEHLPRLAGWEVWPALERLAPPQTTSVAAFKALFPKASKHLRELDLSSAKELLEAPESVFDRAEALTSLDIGSTSLGDDGWGVLLAAPSMRRVVHLFANGCSLSDTAVQALARSDLRSLVSLDLSSNKLTDTAFGALAEWPGLEHVVHLRIGNNRKVTAAGFQALIGASAFQPASFDIGKSTDKKLKSQLSERFGDAVISKSA